MIDTIVLRMDHDSLDELWASSKNRLADVSPPDQNRRSCLVKLRLCIKPIPADREEITSENSISDHQPTASVRPHFHLHCRNVVSIKLA